MRHHPPRLRGLAVALVVLATSAGAVLAGGDGPPPAADDGLGIAGEASGKTVPVRVGDELEEAAPETEASLEETTDGAHGVLVSEAAQMETPDGFDNHGAFVSCVARMNRGQLGPDADLSELDLAALTPVECERDDETETETSTGAAPTAGDDGPGKSAVAKSRRDAGTGRGNSPNH